MAKETDLKDAPLHRSVSRLSTRAKGSVACDGFFTRHARGKGQSWCYPCEASCALAALTILSGVNPNLTSKSFSGAEEPKVRIPMTVPFSPV